MLPYINTTLLIGHGLPPEKDDKGTLEFLVITEVPLVNRFQFDYITSSTVALPFNLLISESK